MAEPLIAPPCLSPIVNSPDTTEDTRSLPALADTIALCAVETAGPWSAQSFRQSSINS
mgnify:CR=1 FL=1